MLTILYTGTLSADARGYLECTEATLERLLVPVWLGATVFLALQPATLRALGLERFQIDVGQTEFFRGILEDVAADPATGRELRSALGSMRVRLCGAQ